jgi:hypothetical protein
MSTRTITLSWALVIAVSVAPAALAPGSATGTVVDGTAKPVTHARVFINKAFPPGIFKRPAAPPIITGPRAMTTVTDLTGTFSAGHLPPGQYVACAEYDGQGLLDPCHWATTSPTFTVVAGKTVSGVKITMAKGAVLQIHVNDPQQLLAPTKGGFAPDLVFHVVTAKGHHYQAPIVASTKTSRDHTITIPFATTLTLQAISASLAVNDDTGKPAAAVGKAVSVPVTSATTVVTYTVTGTK